MNGGDHSDSLVLQVLQMLDDFQGGERVETSGGLVEEEEVRTAD